MGTGIIEVWLWKNIIYILWANAIIQHWGQPHGFN
jgi:hypothetical protein